MEGICSQEQNNSTNSGNFVNGNGNSTGNTTNNIHIVTSGLSYTDVRQICLDLFKDNFIELKKEANKVIEERIDEFTESYIESIKNKNIEILEELKNPDMQYVLYEGQKNYARYGSKELLDRLIFLLAERTENVEKDIIQLNLNEAIGIASKMTEKQNNLLTIAFILRRVEWPNVQNIEDLVYKIKTQVISFIPKDKEIRTDIEYLTYLGCGNSLLGDNLEDILKRRYPGIFKGIDDTKAYLLDKLPEIKELFELWNDKELCTYNITTVGLTIGWANFSNKLNINAGLDIWLK